MATFDLMAEEIAVKDRKRERKKLDPDLSDIFGDFKAPHFQGLSEKPPDFKNSKCPAHILFSDCYPDEAREEFAK